jgi:hypothetical protein
MQLDDRSLSPNQASENAEPVNDSAYRALDVGPESETRGQQQELVGTNAGRQDSSRLDPAIQEIVDRARAAQRQTDAARRTHAEAEARFRRAEEAWLRVRSFKGDRIPRGLSRGAALRCYAELIVELGNVLQADGWQARVDAVSPGSEAKTYALAMLRRGMDGDLVAVEEMVKQGIGTLFHLGLKADVWLRDGLRCEVLNLRPPAEAPLSWAEFSAPPVDSEPGAEETRTIGSTLEGDPEPLSAIQTGGASAEALVTRYLAGEPNALIGEVARATGLTKLKIQRTQAWKKHEERRLDTFLRAQPQAGTGDVKQVLGLSPGKTAGMRAWKEHRARKEAAKPPRPVKERPLSDNILCCRPDEAVADPAAKAEDRDQILQVIREEADPDTRGRINRLRPAEQEALLDHIVGTTAGGEGLDTNDSARKLALLLEITKSWLDDHEQECRHARRSGSAR